MKVRMYIKKREVDEVLRELENGEKMHYNDQSINHCNSECDGFHGSAEVFYKNKKYFMQELNGFHSNYINLPKPVKISKRDVVKYIRERLNNGAILEDIIQYQYPEKIE